MTVSPCHPSRFSPEFQLACACCRVRPNDADKAAIQRLLPQIDVPAFLQLVLRRHRIGPLTLNALKQVPAEWLPEGLMAPLTADAQANRHKAMRSVRTHVLLDRWFRAASIPWMPFKGISVALRYYGDVSLRQVNDLDIWVPQDRLEDARRVLGENGFAWDPCETAWDLADRGPRHRNYLVRYHYQERHHSADCGLIELHWQLTDNRHQFRLAPHELLIQSDVITMGGAELQLINDTDLLLYLCEHGSRHGWYRLKWLADLPQLLEQRTWNWEATLRRASEAGCQGSLLLGLSLARDLFGWSPPPVLAWQLRRRHSLRMQTGVVHFGLEAPHSWWSVPYALPLRWHLRLIASRVLLLGGWQALGTILWRYSLSPNDLRVAPLPDRWFFLYRLARPLLHGLRRVRLFGAAD
jgi:hypothetical protein